MPRIEPLTAERWQDFAALCARMGPNRSCWCMWWRSDGTSARASARQRARDLVATSARPTGLLAYDGAQPIGWAAVGPREAYPRLNRGRVTAPIDARTDVWAVPCFFVVAERRGQGVSRALLAAAVDLAFASGAGAVEGVPGDPATKPRSATAAYTGTVGLFATLGFAEVARRTPRGRVVMRLEAPFSGSAPGAG